MFQLKVDHTITAVLGFLVRLQQEQIEFAKLHVTSDSLTITGINDTMTSLTRVLVGKASCETFSYTQDLVVSVTLKALAAVLSCVGPTETLTLTIKDEHLVIQTNDATEFEINLMELDTEDLAIPNVENVAKVDTVDVTAMMKKIKKLEAHTIGLSLVDGAMDVQVQGDLVQKADFQLQSDMTKQQDLRVNVSANLLGWLLKFGKIEKKFGVSMGEGRPVGVHAAVQHVRVDAFLAPMMDE